MLKLSNEYRITTRDVIWLNKSYGEWIHKNIHDPIKTEPTDATTGLDMKEILMEWVSNTNGNIKKLNSNIDTNNILRTSRRSQMRHKRNKEYGLVTIENTRDPVEYNE